MRLAPPPPQTCAPGRNTHRQSASGRGARDCQASQPVQLGPKRARVRATYASPRPIPALLTSSQRCWAACARLRCQPEVLSGGAQGRGARERESAVYWYSFSNPEPEVLQVQGLACVCSFAATFLLAADGSARFVLPASEARLSSHDRGCVAHCIQRRRLSPPPSPPHLQSSLSSPPSLPPCVLPAPFLRGTTSGGRKRTSASTRRP